MTSDLITEERLRKIERELNVLKAHVKPIPGATELPYAGWKFLQSPLLSDAWSDDTFGTVSPTQIDLYAVFGVPIGAKAIMMRARVKDSSATEGNFYWAGGPNSTYAGMMVCKSRGLNQYGYTFSPIITSNGQYIYYQTYASAAGALTVLLQIWGYML